MKVHHSSEVKLIGETSPSSLLLQHKGSIVSLVIAISKLLATSQLYVPLCIISQFHTTIKKVEL